MGQIITEEYKKGCNVTVVTTMIPSTPITNVGLHFGTDPRTAPATSSKEIMIKNIEVDETAVAPTGKQFASADLICCEDGSTTLVIPSVEYNLQGSCSLTEDDMPEDCGTCNTDAEMKKAGAKKEVFVQTALYGGVLNRTIEIGMNILLNGKLEAHNSAYDFGQSHIYAATAKEKYSDGAFDPMTFISKQLDKGIFDKVTISGADIGLFRNAIKNCGTNECTTKGFVPATVTQGTPSLAEKGLIHVGTHEATATPIYAASAKVKEKVRNETTGKVEKKQIDLVPAGVMIFTAGKPIKHKFGGLQIERNGVSIPRRIKFRQFKEVDKGTQLVNTRLQTSLTPYIVTFSNVLVVKGLV